MIVVVTANTGTLTESGVLDAGSGTKTETIEEKKDKEKTINDINTFLIESYKIKIDHILANLNISLERVTNNDPVAQAKLLEKIRNDISIKIQAINSRNISVNRKKILPLCFLISKKISMLKSRSVQKEIVSFFAFFHLFAILSPLLQKMLLIAFFLFFYLYILEPLTSELPYDSTNHYCRTSQCGKIQPFFNVLSGHKIAIVSDTENTTRYRRTLKCTT